MTNRVKTLHTTEYLKAGIWHNYQTYFFDKNTLSISLNKVIFGEI